MSLRGEALDAAAGAALEQVAERDHGLLRQLCYGSLRHYHRLDGLLDASDKPLKRRDTDIHMLLLVIGLHQLLDAHS